jgi:hypothetical protein
VEGLLRSSWPGLTRPSTQSRARVSTWMPRSSPGMTTERARRHCERKRSNPEHARRNDGGETRVRVLAAAFARVLLTSPPSRENRGRREDRVAACTRGPRAKNCAKSALTTGTDGISPASPAQWFYNLYVLSPVNQRLPPSFALRLKGVAEFSACMGAPGPHDFAVRVCAARQPARPRPPHSAPRFVTTRNAPRDGAERGYDNHIF